MLKKIMKAALAASLVFGMSSFAYAADGIKLGFDAVEYFGQYDTGADGYSAHLESIGEAHIKVTGKLGKLSLYHEQEYEKTVDTDNTGRHNDDFENTQTRLTYDFGPAAVTLGNIVNIGTLPLSSSGFKTSNVPGSTAMALSFSGYSEYEGLDVKIPIEGVGFIQATIREDAFNYASYYAKNFVGATYPAATGVTEGTMYTLGANLQFGPLTVRAGYTTAETDDPTDDDDDALKTTGMMLGAKFALNKDIAFTAEYSAAKVDHDDFDDPFDETAMDVGASIQAGPGKIVLRYEMVNFAMDDDIVDWTRMHLVYDIPVAKAAGVQFGYASIAKDWESDAKDDDTETYLAGGFYVRF